MYILTIISTLLSIILFIFNIVQYKNNNELRNKIKSQIQSNFNMYYQIARACTRASSCNKLEENKSKVYEEIQIIRGTVDAARSCLISFGREEFKFMPYYEHPSKPGQIFQDSVMYGDRPENIKSKEE